jgi:nucleotide-binding universal stress UspA family protein
VPLRKNRPVYGEEGRDAWARWRYGAGAEDYGNDDAVGGAEEGRPRKRPVILVLVDFSPISIEAARFGVRLAHDSRGLLVLVRAIHLSLTPYGPANPIQLKVGLGHEAMTKAEPILARTREAGVTAVCAVEEGAPASVVTRTAKRWGAAVVIMGDARQGVLGRWFGPKTVEKVAREVECPVLVLRTDARKASDEKD